MEIERPSLEIAGPDTSIAVLLRNESPRERAVDVAIGGRTVSGSMPPDSFNTLLLRDAGPHTGGI